MNPIIRLIPVTFVSLFHSNMEGQNVSTVVPSIEVEASIPGSIYDGNAQVPPPPSEKPDFRIESTQVKLLDVAEPPPMEGLPPVEGTITLKVHSVSDPGLPDPPPLSPGASVDDPQVRERLAEMSSKHREKRIVFLSATVHDHSRTLLTCYPNGAADKAVTIWSNVDFNHFIGFSSFEATTGGGESRNYSLLMGIGN
jgi:hypothetical protein